MSFGLAQQRKVSKVGDSKISSSADHHASILHNNNDNSYYSTAAVGLAPDSLSYVQRAIGNNDNDNNNNNHHHQSANNNNNNNGSKELMHSNYNAPDNNRLDSARGINNIQPKLKVSQPGDIYEQEADRVAEKVMMSMPSVPFFYSAAQPIGRTPKGKAIDKKCAACEMKGQGEKKEEEEEKKEQLNISRKPSTASSSSYSSWEANDQVALQISSIRSGSGGSSLDPLTRDFMETRFGGYDFGNVRIHADVQAAKSAESINALAYTIGNHITFGQGQYSPNSIQGKRLLAHELTHVVQQGSGLESGVQPDVIQRQPCPTPPKTPEPGAIKYVRVMPSDGLVRVALINGKHFTVQLDVTRTTLDKGTYTAVHMKGDPKDKPKEEEKDCIVGQLKSKAWYIAGNVPLAGGWKSIPSSSYELIVTESSEAFEPDPSDIGKKARAAKDKGAGEGVGAGKKAKAAKDKAHGKGGTGGGQQQSSPDEDRKVLDDFQKQLGEAGTDASVPPDTEVAAALKELTEAERADLARYLRETKAKADDEGKAFDVKTMIKYYKDLSPSDRELLRTNLELAKSATGATELPKQVQIALDVGAEKTAAAATQQVKNLNGQLGTIHAKLKPDSRTKPEDLEPIDLNKVPIFTEMMMLEGLLAGASSKSPEIQTIAMELMDSIHGIRDYVLEEIAWLVAELAATQIIAALAAPFTAGASEIAGAVEAASVMKRLNDLRIFLQKVEKIYNTIQKIRGLINKVIGVYETYKRLKLQYDKWLGQIEQLQSMLERAADADDDLEEQIEIIENEMIEKLQKSLDDPQGMGALLEQFFIPAGTPVEELKEILFNIPKGVDAFRDLISYYGTVDRTNIEDVKTLAYKGVRAGVLLYPFVGYLAMVIGNELSALMAQPDLSDRLMGIFTRASDKAKKRKPPSAGANREELRKVKQNKASKRKPKGKDKRKADDPKAHKKKAGEQESEDPKATKKKGDVKKDDDKEDEKKKKEREEKAHSDSEWAQIVAKVVALKGQFASTGITKGDLLKEARKIIKEARKISKAQNSVAGGPKIVEPSGKAVWVLTIARKKSTDAPAKTEVLINESARWNKGRRAVEAKVAGLPDNQRLDKASIEAQIKPLQDAFGFKTLRVDNRTDSRQGLAVFGAMPTGSERVITTVDDMSNLHTGTQSDPIPIRWYKEPGNYAKNIKLRVDGKNYTDFPINSPHLLTRKKRNVGDVDIFVGIDTKNMVKINDVLVRKSTSRTGTKQDDYRKALREAGFDWTGRDADHVLDLGFAGADDFENLWPLEFNRNRWAFTERWYKQYYVEYKDPAHPREAQVGSLFGLKGKYFKVKKYSQELPKLGGRSNPKN